MSLSKHKVLLLNVNREGWHSGNMIYDMWCVQQACETVIYGPGWPNYKTTDLKEIIHQIYGDDKPDVIYSYFTPNEKVGNVYINHYNIPERLHNFPTGFDKVKGIKKVFALSDFWARTPERFSKDLGGLEFSHMFSCFTPPYSKERHFNAFFDQKIRDNMKFVAHPRCVEETCFRDYGLDKEYDVITLGAMSNFYSFRRGMHNTLSTVAKKIGINYKNYTHCGANFNHTSFVRDDYAKAISQSKILVSCGGRYHLAFNKIFEAMGCGTLYIGEKPFGEKELALEDGVNYVAVTKSNFLEKIKYYVDNDSERQTIIDNAKQTFKDHHTIDARAKDFAKLIEELLNEGENNGI
jgi:glycosyltransferase involved in cell wall biosynthesis